ncbi:MAG TPA: phosphate-starvation-inducible PsiE family protein [Nitrospiraceae bacterium]|jgi:phosphate starvation-inducible membrane PsiE|nr:phosphate-starvation-inducible PsiE family protein [Nitrospiraceae bacterium]
MQDRTDAMKKWLNRMEWLDRWGYITAGLSLLFLGMLIFAHSWTIFIQEAVQEGLLLAGLKLLNNLLLVIILLELSRTVVRFLQTDILTLEPYLAVGIIACIRRILTASAELSHLPQITTDLFNRYLIDVGLNVGVVLVLIFAVFIVRKRPAQAGTATPFGT